MATKKSTEAVLQHHVQALISRDLDAVCVDYADDAVIFSPNGAFIGPQAIRECFIGVQGMLTPEELNNMKLIKQDINGDYAYVVWSTPSIPMGSDTFCVRDGKIVMQSFVAQMNR
jgi:ketosteroid isomerase-like protein